MTPQQLSDIMGEVQTAVFKMACCTCNKPLQIYCERTSPADIAITGGALCRPPADWNLTDQIMAKCDACHTADPKFHRPTEVYSRITGYMRPLKNWNDAKRNEFELRKTYDASLRT